MSTKSGDPPPQPAAQNAIKDGASLLPMTRALLETQSEAFGSMEPI
jgi:hypothetical protein